MIARTQNIIFTPDRLPVPRKIRVGYEGDNLVERLNFVLPKISESQTAMFVHSGSYADMAALVKSDIEDEYYIDLTSALIGDEGVQDVCITIAGSTGEVWSSGPLTIQVGGVPNVANEIANKNPTVIIQMQQDIRKNSSAVQKIDDILSGGEDGQILGMVDGAVAWMTGGAGPRGCGYLKISTLPNNVIGEYEGIAYSHRLQTDIVLAESGAEEVFVGDTLVYGNTTYYPVVAVAGIWVYCSTKTGARGCGYLMIDTQPTASIGVYEDANGSVPYNYRISTSTALLESGANDVLIGDVLVHGGATHYPVVFSGKNVTYLGEAINIGSGGAGVSPEIDVNKSGNVTTITITDATGTKTATISDGADGKTPVAGTDYFTQADKEELVAAVKSALPTLTLTGTDKNDVVHTWTIYGV